MTIAALETVPMPSGAEECIRPSGKTPAAPAAEEYIRPSGKTPAAPAAEEYIRPSGKQTKRLAQGKQGRRRQRQGEEIFAWEFSFFWRIFAQDEPSVILPICGRENLTETRGTRGRKSESWKTPPRTCTPITAHLLYKTIDFKYL
ncbi:MAG: hypothetical protein ACP5FH_02835 [Terracidiphilus sp.]